jgi:hypothetical protein
VKAWEAQLPSSPWGLHTAETAPGAICAGFRGSIEEMEPDEELIRDAGRGDAALDLGAGVGRNAIPLAISFRAVVAYDLPNMCAMMQAREDWPGNARILSDWEEARMIAYDVAIACLLFQHLPPEASRAYLEDLRCERLLVVSRSWIDGDKESRVLPLLEERFERIRLREEGEEHFRWEGRLR